MKGFVYNAKDEIFRGDPSTILYFQTQDGRHWTTRIVIGFNNYSQWRDIINKVKSGVKKVYLEDLQAHPSYNGTINSDHSPVECLSPEEESKQGRFEFG